MVPSVFVTLDRLPLTPNGKIDRKALPAPQNGLLQAAEDFVAPRDAVEQMLAGLWSKVLRVKPVGLRDNFFELGGHSLAAVKLLAEVQKLTGKTLPLATLFQASTVEKLAEILRNDGWTPSWSSLVTMREQGTKDPLFLVHGAEGNVLLYRQLVERLGPDQPAFGLQSQGLNGKGQLPTSIPEMAAHYVKEIMGVQPDGPYLLAGYCLGGTIAFEMAQQLKVLGKEVELVIMLDSYNEAVVSRPKAMAQIPVHAVQNLWFHVANLVSVHGADRRKFLHEKFDVARSRLEVRVRSLAHSVQRWVSKGKDQDYLRLALQRINDRAAIEYVPQPYEGRVAVFRSRGSFAGLTSPSLGWSGVVGRGLEVVEVPVYPKGMLVAPFCDLLADRVRLCLEKG
jgi:thioesterase domain-containing protein/acyl carrier protein